MEFKTTKGELIHALGIVIGAVNPRNTLPILTNILIETCGDEGVRFTATDLEIGISTQALSKNNKEGSITVPARKIFEIARELPDGDVSVTVAKNNAVNIKTGKTYCRVMGLGREDFPKLPEFSLDGAVEIDQKIVKECLALTSFAISSDETRYVLNGILIDINGSKIRFIATDGRRLAFIEREIPVKSEKTAKFIIPSKTVNELNKILGTEGKLRLAQSHNQIVFSLDETVLISRLIEGHFPNYDQVIPKEENTSGQIDRKLLLSAVRRAALFTTQDAQAVKLDFVKDKILVSSHSANLGEAKEEVEAKVNGEEVSIGFNPHYLMDVLKNLDIDQVSFSLTKPDKPGLLKANNNYLYVVMPMQIN
ncbi:MAG: DNA polymerase III subunit beta [Candidatus Omnitrophica bacterium CG11_big_fil_rev_8_21_14_0_20_45_26]|uniref:Beta sliding clamp n=1 Tax=Candidatus Abzuiibacterium crystallinum TaxID=1974748 RepID=A0A2H0LNH0_9BACT|nr:MAG: DNA polymerase III subunit beta [Candidatus Omnitrophica bacterium CG11_big_fil_rev_8_21_14_0_20_45_26]PIW64730.1 MAG: DNA polymerase III subunit beta [Candidatus Omnitrophica bacterium CG12_big_fil_rev_8_21_14_0_65_45_16]